MSARGKLLHLQRMAQMKEERLAGYQGVNDSWLRVDIAALRWAIEVLEPIVFEYPSGGATLRERAAGEAGALTNPAVEPPGRAGGRQL